MNCDPLVDFLHDYICHAAAVLLTLLAAGARRSSSAQQRVEPSSVGGAHSSCNCVTTLSWVVALRRFVYTLHSTVVYYSFTYKYCTHNLLKFQQNTGLKGTSLKKGPP